MITVERTGVPGEIIVEVAAPLSADEFRRAGELCRPAMQEQTKLRVLVIIDSLELPSPTALWEDLKLTPYVRRIEKAAVVTDLYWYAKLAEATGAVWPGLQIEHFGPGEQSAAVDWLRAARAE